MNHLRHFMVVVLCLGFYFISFAQIESNSSIDKVVNIQSQGYSSGFCQGNSSDFCISDLTRRAAYDGERNANWECRSRKGRLEFGSAANCSTFCNPSFIPPDSSGTSVSCRANCWFRCFIEDQREY